jgi:hypothetical protein
LFGKYDFIAKLRFNLLQKKIKIICKYLILWHKKTCIVLTIQVFFGDYNISF